MDKIINKSKSILCNLPEFMVAFLIISIVMTVFIEFIVREVFKVSIFGFTGELNRILMIWLTMVGAAVAVKRGSHFVFPIVAQRLEVKGSHFFSLLSNFSIIGFAVILIIFGIKNTFMSRNEFFIAIRISLSWEYLSVPVSGALMIPYCLINIIDQMKSKKEGEASCIHNPR